MIVNVGHSHVACEIVDNTIIIMECNKIVGRNIVEMKVHTRMNKEYKQIGTMEL